MGARRSEQQPPKQGGGGDFRTPGRAFISGERKGGVQGRDEEQPTWLLLLLFLLLSAKRINGVQAARGGAAARQSR